MLTKNNLKNVLKSIWRPNNRYAPFKDISLIDQTRREPVDRVLAKICTTKQDQ